MQLLGGPALPERGLLLVPLVDALPHGLIDDEEQKDCEQQRLQPVREQHVEQHAWRGTAQRCQHHARVLRACIRIRLCKNVRLTAFKCEADGHFLAAKTCNKC